MNTKELGDLGERIACEHLVKKGFNILGKNYRISFGEIDIIVKKKWKLLSKNDKAIHFVEVKTIIGDNDSFFPEERVDAKKQKKLAQLSQIWLEHQNYKQNQPYQIDVVGVLINKNTKIAKVSYFENVVEDLY